MFETITTGQAVLILGGVLAAGATVAGVWNLLTWLRTPTLESNRAMIERTIRVAKADLDIVVPPNMTVEQFLKEHQRVMLDWPKEVEPSA